MHVALNEQQLSGAADAQNHRQIAGRASADQEPGLLRSEAIRGQSFGFRDDSFRMVQVVRIRQLRHVQRQQLREPARRIVRGPIGALLMSGHVEGGRALPGAPRQRFIQGGPFGV